VVEGTDQEEVNARDDVEISDDHVIEDHPANSIAASAAIKEAVRRNIEKAQKHQKKNYDKRVAQPEVRVFTNIRFWLSAKLFQMSSYFISCSRYSQIASSSTQVLMLSLFISTICSGNESFEEKS
jgi:hypothetical protein